MSVTLKTVKSSSKFKRKHPGLTLVSAKDAARLAGVSYKAIMYHIHQSKKVQGYYNVASDRVCVVWEDLVALYPETKSGVKQAREAEVSVTRTEYDVWASLLAEYSKKHWKGKTVEAVIDDLTVKMKNYRGNMK